MPVHPEGRAVFYARPAPEPAPPSADIPSPQGLRTRAEHKLYSLQSRWRHPEGRATKAAKIAWDWLHARTHPDEPLLARLRTAARVELHHPRHLPADAVHAAWLEHLKRARRRHWGWFVANLLVAPVTVLLAPLPGPNLVGYWFAYRALHHGLILHGLGHVRRGRLATEMHAVDEGEPDAALSALGCDPGALDLFLRRHRVTAAEQPVKPG